MRLNCKYCGKGYRLKTMCLWVPADLFILPEFAQLSFEAKALYGFLINMQLHFGRTDASGNQYLPYTNEHVMGILGCGKQHAGTVLRELDSVHGIGLLSRKKQKTGETYMYVKDYVSGEVTKCGV